MDSYTWSGLGKEISEKSKPLRKGERDNIWLIEELNDWLLLGSNYVACGYQ